MNIEREGKNIIVTIPAFGVRSNPWDDEQDEPYDAILGVIEPVPHSDEPDCWFSHAIDMAYKGKADQVGDYIVKWQGDQESFVQKCTDLDIDIVEYQKCAKCKKAIHGTSTASMELTKKYGGPVCSITCDKI